MSKEDIDACIVVLRGEKVLLDRDLARLYGVTTSRLNEQVKRNASRFPPDFSFRLANHEVRALMSQIAISKGGGLRKPPLAFTEHGAIMAAAVLKSPKAIQVSVFVVRAFIRLRQAVANHKELARKLDQLEKRTAHLALRHDELSVATRTQFQQVLEALRQLMAPIATSKRPIGFVTPKD
ncbi:MAG TPA: ORF6N domain-containing protein [Burkholderiales bacterium]|nr:ORF6N domain-containing protein [Burkholderiales bacterium]